MRARQKILGLIFLLCALASTAKSFATVAEGQPAPALVLKELDGTPFDLSALKGKTVLVHFWATWCPPCKEEMPILDSFYKKYHSQGVEMVAVSVDSKHARDDVVKFMQPLSFPAAVTSDVQTNDFGSPPVLPITYVINKNGILTTILSPAYAPLSEQSLINALSPGLAK